FQILGFTGIDDIRTLSGNIISEVFAQSCERFMEIRNQFLLLFRFKSRAKETSDLKSAIKAINAIAGNWCINRRPYNGTGFGDKGAPELPPYRPKTDNDIQELFDSIG